MCGTADLTNNSFSPEQQAYLENLLGQLDLAAAFVRPTAEAAQEVTVHGTPYEDLAGEEVLKAEKHPWDYWPRMKLSARENRFAEGGDNFMFKHHGMFNVAPAQAGYMCRLRIPGGLLRGDQLSMLGDAAEEMGGGYAHLTTRGNLQVREIQPPDMVRFLERLYEIGLTAKGSGADSVRNITLSPTSGFDPDELIDLREQAVDTHHLILNSRDLHGLPRKFNIAFDTGGHASCVSDTNNIGYLATEVGDDDGGKRILCEVMLGGITGHGDFARPTGWFLRPDDTVAASDAMLRVFVEHGDRTNRKKARLKYVLDAKGDDWFVERSQEKLDAMVEAGEAAAGARFERIDRERCTPRVAMDRLAHVGVHEQADGQFHVGVLFPAGRLSPDQMRGIGALAERYGQNNLRLTVWQNLLIPHVDGRDVAAVEAGLAELGLASSKTSFHAGAVACTGKWACKYGAAHTKENLVPIVEHLAERFELDSPINLHVTGCANSCAQHYIGNVGLLGATTADGEEAFQVFLGGGSDADQGIGRFLCGPVPAVQVKFLLEQVVATYLEQRQDAETFLAFTRRHEIEELQELFAREEAIAG